MRLEKQFIGIAAIFLMLGFYKSLGADEGVCVAFCDDPSPPSDSSLSYEPDSYPQSTYTQPSVNYEALFHEYNEKGLAASAAGNYLLAIEYYDKALAIRDSQTVRQNKGAAQNALGVEYFVNGDFREALALFESANYNKPDSEIILLNISEAIKEVDKLDDRVNLKNALSDSISAMSRSSTTTAPSSFDFKAPSKATKETTTENKDDEQIKNDNVFAFKKLKSKNITSPLPTYSKGNEFSAPVDLSDKHTGKDQQGVVDLKSIQGDKNIKAGIRFKEVPLPPDVQKRFSDVSAFGGDPYKGFKNRADLILDALEFGSGNLEKSVEFLQDKVAVQGKNIEGVDALSYLEGLHLGAIAANADVFKDDVVSYDLLGGFIKEQNFSWPGSTNSDQSLPNPLHWKTKRSAVLMEALEMGRGNKEDSLRYLENKMRESSSKSEDSANAYYYLIGLDAYPEFKKQQSQQK